MPFILWDEIYQTGIASIDDQHKHLISRINRMFEAMMQSKAKEELAYIIDELQKYRHYHFSTEEDYMQKAGYKELDAHRQEHDTFTVRVDEFMKRYQEGDEGLTAELMVYLTTWIHEHLSGTDQNYVACLQEHGIT